MGEFLSNLLLNLGVIYFMKGSEHLGSKISADNNNDAETSEKEKKEAIKNFEAARDTYKEALEQSQCREQACLFLTPDIYILDEYARVNFNLAFLADFDNSSHISTQNSPSPARGVSLSCPRRGQGEVGGGEVGEFLSNLLLNLSAIYSMNGS